MRKPLAVKAKQKYTMKNIQQNFIFRTISFTLIFLTVMSKSYSFNCKDSLIWTNPFKAIDFSSGEWFLVYTKTVSDSISNKNFGIRRDSVNIINDENLLELLKMQFTCDITKQRDGYTCYVIELFYNKELFNYFVFDNLENFSLGGLKNHFKPVKVEEIEYNGIKKFKNSIFNLKKNNIDYTFHNELTKFSESKDGNLHQTSIDSSLNYIYSIKISFRSVGLNHDCKKAENEFIKIYPELTTINNGLTFNSHTPIFNNYLLYKIEFACTKDFKIDTNRLKNNINVIDFRDIKHRPLKYHLTIYRTSNKPIVTTIRDW